MFRSFLPILLSVMLAAAGVCLAIVRKSNSYLDAALSLSNSKADVAAQEKDALQQQLVRLKNQRDSLHSTKKELEASLANANAIVSDQERRISDLIKAYDELNKKYDGVLDRQKQRFQKLADLASVSTGLASENKKLTTKLASLMEHNQKLTAELSSAKGLEKDNIFIEPLDEDDMPCAIGSRVKKIVATLSLPSEIKSPVVKMFDPDGQPLPDPGGHFHFVASNESNSQKMKKLELTYLLPKKIGSGLYRVEIANEGKHIGNLLMKFR